MDSKDIKNKGLSGLVNLGNTCYLNSAIQVLSNSTPLLLYFLSKEYEEDVDLRKKESSMVTQYYRLMEGLWDDNCIVKPISFRKTLAEFEPKFRGFQQQDSQEALSKMIDLLHTGLSYEVKIDYVGMPQNKKDELEIESIKTWKDKFSSEYSKILELFYGQFHSTISCEKCGYSSDSFDPFCIMSVPITKDCVNIYDCIREFTKPEQLDEENKWKCDKCGELSSAGKKIDIWKMPEILIITLKRFNFGMSANKINKSIDFPIDNLNLEEFSSGYKRHNFKYELYGIINHTGQVNGGHYFAYCKNPNGKWYEYNDSSVREITELDIDNTYTILYQKMN